MISFKQELRIFTWKTTGEHTYFALLPRVTLSLFTVVHNSTPKFCNIFRYCCPIPHSIDYIQLDLIADCYSEHERGKKSIVCLNISWLPMGKFSHLVNHCVITSSNFVKNIWKTVIMPRVRVTVWSTRQFKQFPRLVVFVISLKIFDKYRLCAQIINTRKFINQTFK